MLGQSVNNRKCRRKKEGKGNTIATPGTKKRGLKATVLAIAQHALGGGASTGDPLLAVSIKGEYRQGAITEIDGHPQRGVGIFLISI